MARRTDFRKARTAFLDATALYFSMVRYSIAAQLQYRASFVMQSVSHLVVTGIEFLGIWALFARFGTLDGWTLPEVALFYGSINIAFAIADALGRGFDVFSIQVKSGSFDRLLLRPRSTVLQLFGHEFTMRRVGRLAQGAAVLAYAVLALDLAPVAIVVIAASVSGAVLLFLGLYIVQATLAFWTVETLEIMNTMTYGGVETAQYPMEIYRSWFRRFFTFIVPLAGVTWFPISMLVGRSPVSAPVAWFAPATGLVFFLLSLLAWRFGVRRYTSTGS